MKIADIIGFLILIILITYGSFYYSYKYSNPNLGNNDYYKYKIMVEKPIQINSSESPFIYRQFTTVIASLIYKSGLFYKSTIAYNCTENEQRIFFSLLLSNYLGLIGTNFLIIYISIHLYKIKSFINNIFFVFLNITTFNYIFNGLAPLTEGWTLFFNILLFFLYKKMSLLLYFIVIIISIIQKEIICIFFTIFTIINLIINYILYKKIDYRKLLLAMVSILALIFYIILRKYILIVNGYENQLNILAWFEKIKKFNIVFDFHYIKQGILSNGIIFIYILILIWFKIKIKFNSHIAILLSSLIIIYILGIFTSIGNNIGRIIASFTPILILTLFSNIKDLNIENRNSKNI